jgi:multiple sugar transport system ATP-binding protein
MLYATHDQKEAITLADRIAIMDMGKVVQTGTPQGIFHQPVNLYVAEFIGEPPINLLQCQAQLQGDSYQLTFQGNAVPLSTDSCC